ncbi:MAG: circularly permuted type 2 ATP-grasp protein [Verrucomicrobia bacterium]|nr:circularly permuted type 2 ATP-grasp protein [Verrucomicrobiota bacterium]MBV9671921.1 circularly permuted type 2 ATP-grasp protein [Verrucomicrobiota bacterium]
MIHNGTQAQNRWNEVLTPEGQPHPTYVQVLQSLERITDLRELEERLEATLRELGITFELPLDGRRNSWFCDLLPQMFSAEEWDLIVRGFQQRIRAFELFLADIYGERQILKDGLIPIPVVLGSPNYQRSAIGLRPANGHFLHLSGLCILRDSSGHLAIKHHYFSHPSGISYMIQNRRLLARVLPELFDCAQVESIADVPTEILLSLKSVSPRTDGSAVLLTPGISSAVYSEHAFLARRMGIPLVEGGDLLVLDDCLFLRTVSGLDRIDVVYTRVADLWLDPLVFKKDSPHGIPGLVHCMRKGTVAVVNSIGSQIADDRSLLFVSSVIIRYYLAEMPILPVLQTYWLGDLDQREVVLEQPEQFRFRHLTGEKFLQCSADEKSCNDLRGELKRAPHLYVAQPVEDCAETVCIFNGKRSVRLQDHIVYGIREGDQFKVFPGALTRVSSQAEGRPESEHRGGGKDTWVLQEFSSQRSLQVLVRRPRTTMARVTSRVAEGFFWLGRYLERAMNVSRMIQVIETLEMEELNSAERKLYRPVWDRLLPPLEQPGKKGRRSMTSPIERHRLMLGVTSGSVISMVQRAVRNADRLRETISPEAWLVLADLRTSFQRVRFRETVPDSEARKITRRLAELAVSGIPQFFATAQFSMLADDGWRFGELGQFVERAVTTANAASSVAQSVVRRPRGGSIEIELSAFLRLLGCRDAYRRVYQNRAEPPYVLEFLWQNAQMPRSITFCLRRCAELLAASLPETSLSTQTALGFLEEFAKKVLRVDFYCFFSNSEEEEMLLVRKDELISHLDELVYETRKLNGVITDNFLSHQNVISRPEPTLF